MIDNIGAEREIPYVHTVIADNQKRVRVPDAKPKQVFAYSAEPDGRLILTPVIVPSKRGAKVVRRKGQLPVVKSPADHILTSDQVKALADGVLE